MKKSVGAVITVMIGFSLIACAKTPEKAIVVDKSEGLPKDSVIPNDNDTPKDVGIPSYWKETIEKSDGYVTLEADYDMEIPEVYNTPVYSYEMKPLGGKLLKKLCDYFAEGNKLYEYPAMTKDELRTQKKSIEGQKGKWAGYEESGLTGMLTRLDELIEKAPDEKTVTYVKTTLKKPYQTEEEYVNEADAYMYGQNSSYYFDTNEKIGFKVRIDRGQKVDPVIFAINYNEKLGSTSNFLFSQGTFIDEKALWHKIENQEIFGFGKKYDVYLNYLQSEMEKNTDKTFTEENAVKKVREILKDLEIKDFEVTEVYKAIGSLESESWGILDEENLTMSEGFSVYLAPKAGKLIGYEQPFQEPFTDLPETIYAPTFSTEKIHVIVTEEGIQQFEWTNISQRKETIAENTKLLSFEEIKKKAAEHLLYISLSGYREKDKEDGYSYKFILEDVKLRMSNVPAYEDPSAVWLVPVWVFEFKEERINPSGEIMRMNNEIVLLNAIDGGYIRPRLDPRVSMPEY